MEKRIRGRASFTKALIHELGKLGRDIISIWEDFNDVDKLEEHGPLKGHFITVKYQWF
jgi:hypothetical protein